MAAAEAFGRVGARGSLLLKPTMVLSVSCHTQAALRLCRSRSVWPADGQHRACGVTRVLPLADLGLVCCQGRVWQGMGCPGLAAQYTMGGFLRHPAAIRSRQVLAGELGLSVLLVTVKGSGPSTPCRRCVLCARCACARGNPCNTVFQPQLIEKVLSVPFCCQSKCMRVAPRPVRLAGCGVGFLAGPVAQWSPGSAAFRTEAGSPCKVVRGFWPVGGVGDLEGAPWNARLRREWSVNASPGPSAPTNAWCP